jgi:hypothetical protein
MHADVQLNLALILFLPWYLILGALYWIYPRQPRNRRRRVFDGFALAVATVASALSMYWSMFNADPKWGHMWQQILATSVSYGVFLGVMTIALIVRYRWITGPRTRP